MRKRLLQYDDVLNKQREVIYGIRNDTLHSEKPKDIIFELIEEELGEQLDKLPGTVFKNGEEKDWEPFLNWIHGTFPLSIKLEEIAKQNIEKVEHLCLEKIKDAYAIKEQVEDSEALIELERYVIIRSIDRNWQDHLTEMEELRRAVSLRGYAQKDPLNEYKSEAYVYFEQLMETVRTEICTGIFRSATRPESFQSMINILNKNVNISGPADEDQSLIGQLKKNANAQARAQKEKEQENVELPKITIRRDEPKIGRNDPCPCGNGKKYKKCCGKDLV
jgi:preprotein translocase subunit SecA